MIVYAASNLDTYEDFRLFLLNNEDMRGSMALTEDQARDNRPPMRRSYIHPIRLERVS